VLNHIGPNPSVNPVLLAELFLSIHLLVVFFIVSGLVLIPLGASLRWPFVASFWYRAVHMGAIAIVALQKFFGKLCFLSVWEFDTLQEAAHRESDMQPVLALGDRLIHWNLPLWFFTVLYALTWAYVIWLWLRFPPRTGRRSWRRTPRPMARV
jgi:hypothetical protein